MPFRLRVFAAVFLALFTLLLVGPLLVPVPPLEGTSPAEDLLSPGDRSATVGGVRIRYREAGSGPLAFLLIHGYPANASTWNEVAPELALYGRTVAFDLPGFGLSARPEAGSWRRGNNPYMPDAAVRQALALLDELGIDRAVWVGSSTGGLTALRAALDHPERVEALVLVNAPVFIDRSPPSWTRPLLSSPQMNRVGPLLMRQLGAEPGMNLFASQWANPGLIDAEDVAGFRLTFMVDDWDRGLWEVSKASRSRDFAAELGNLDVPTLIVAGAADEIVPPEQAERLAREAPGATLAVMEDCGHLPQQECPAAFSQVVTSWISEAVERAGQ